MYTYNITQLGVATFQGPSHTLATIMDSTGLCRALGSEHLTSGLEDSYDGASVEETRLDVPQKSSQCNQAGPYGVFLGQAAPIPSAVPSL